MSGADESEMKRTAEPAAPRPPWAAKAVGLAGRVMMIGFGAFWLSGVLSVFGFIGRELYQEIRKPLFYRPADAVVTKYTPPTTETDEFGDTTETPGIVEYAYHVEGKEYRGRQTQRAAGARQNEYSAELAGPIPEGRRIRAWYDPDEPGRSTLEPIAQPTLLGFLIFMLPFLAAGLGMIFSGLTGKGPVFRMGQPRSAGAKGTGVTMSGGGPYFVTFMITSPLMAFVFFFASMVLDWKTAWAVGAAIVVIVIPALTWLIGGFFARRRRLRAATESVAGERRNAAADKSTAVPIKLPSLGKKLALMIGVTVFWCSLTSVFTGLVVRAIVKHAEAQRRFVTTEGVVLASKVKENKGDSDSGPTYEPLIKYRYTVAGKEHTSTRYTYGLVSTSNYGYVRDTVEAHPKDKKVTVYYDPEDPAEAILRIETPSLTYFALLFLQPFIIIGLGLVAYTATLPSRHRRLREFLESPLAAPWPIPTWGVLRDEADGLAIQRQKTPLGALIALVSGYALACFISVFVIAFLLGAEESRPEAVAAAFAAAAVVGILAALVALALPSRKARLRIDRSLGRLTLVSRQRNVDIRLNDVACWVVRPIEHPSGASSDEKKPLKVPLLALRTDSGDEVAVHVFGAGAAGELVAQKVAREFATLTGKPVVRGPANQPTPTPTSLAEGLASVRQAYLRRKQYRDLL